MARPTRCWGSGHGHWRRSSTRVGVGSWSNVRVVWITITYVYQCARAARLEPREVANVNGPTRRAGGHGPDRFGGLFRARPVPAPGLPVAPIPGTAPGAPIALAERDGSPGSEWTRPAGTSVPHRDRQPSLERRCARGFAISERCRVDVQRASDASGRHSRLTHDEPPVTNHCV